MFALPSRSDFTSRGHGTPVLRIAQNLLAFAGGPIRSDDPVVTRGAELVADYVAWANEGLRASFGAAQLPEDVPPSRVAR